MRCKVVVGGVAQILCDFDWQGLLKAEVSKIVLEEG